MAQPTLAVSLYSSQKLFPPSREWKKKKKKKGGGAVVGKDLRNNLFHFFTILYEKISLEMSFGLEKSLII